jgi:hypothetical protein
LTLIIPAGTSANLTNLTSDAALLIELLSSNASHSLLGHFLPDLQVE